MTVEGTIESSPEVIAQAEAQGWRNDPGHPNFKTADQFLEDGKKIAPIASKMNDKLTAELGAVNKQLDELRKDIFTERFNGEKAGYEKAVNDLNARKEKAFADDDIEELKAIDTEASKLAPPKPPARPAPPVNVDFVQWSTKNPWYSDKSDPMNAGMAAFADAQINSVKAMGLSSAADVYGEIEKRVKAQFPTQFNGGTKQEAATVEADGHRPAKKTGKKDWKSLPKDIRTDATNGKYVEKYFGGDKEKYATAYFAEYGE